MFCLAWDNGTPARMKISARPNDPTECDKLETVLAKEGTQFCSGKETLCAGVPLIENWFDMPRVIFGLGGTHFARINSVECFAVGLSQQPSCLMVTHLNLFCAF